MKIFGMISQNVYLFWKIEIENVGCISTYFCGVYKIN